MATAKCLLSVVMNSGVIYRIRFEDVEDAKKRKEDWCAEEEKFDIKYNDGSVITVNKKFVESINLTPLDTTHVSTSLDEQLDELSSSCLNQTNINKIVTELENIQYSIRSNT